MEMTSNQTAPGITVPTAKRPAIPADLLYQPAEIAWPTLLLFALALAIWIAALYGVLTDAIPSVAAIMILTVAAFIQFTVLHDGVHRSISRKYPILNTVVTNLSGAFLGLLGVGAAFRYVHFKHHRHTNEQGNDPDMWSGKGSLWTLPFQWATADLCYGYIILKEWSTIPVVERAKILGGVGLLGALFSIFAWMGFAKEAFLYWILPSRIALAWLAFAFNYLPHHPHDIEQRYNPYAATSVREGADVLLKWVFLFQNYHLIHHLYPSVPFYRYLRIWRNNRQEFIRQGAPIVPWYGLNPIGKDD